MRRQAAAQWAVLVVDVAKLCERIVARLVEAHSLKTSKMADSRANTPLYVLFHLPALNIFPESSSRTVPALPIRATFVNKVERGKHTQFCSRQIRVFKYRRSIRSKKKRVYVQHWLST